LYPETGLELNHTATAIARLCTGEWTVDDMVEQLTQAYDDVSPDEIRREVCGFLDVLSDRGLLQNAHIHDGSSRNRAVAKRARLPGRSRIASRVIVAVNPRLQQKRS
jgi:hypothetical protein